MRRRVSYMFICSLAHASPAPLPASVTRQRRPQQWLMGLTDASYTCICPWSSPMPGHTVIHHCPNYVCIDCRPFGDSAVMANYPGCFGCFQTTVVSLSPFLCLHSCVGEGYRCRCLRRAFQDGSLVLRQERDDVVPFPTCWNFIATDLWGSWLMSFSADEFHIYFHLSIIEPYHFGNLAFLVVHLNKTKI